MAELVVTAKGQQKGLLRFQGRGYSCILGRSGIVTDKREGDGGTPVGCFPLRRVLYRPDRLAKPETVLPVQAIGPNDGWCDDPSHADYNRPVRLPHPASCEQLWREDHLYDLVVVLGHNDDPPVPGLGSAIFMHLAHPDHKPTQGCLAFSCENLLELLKLCRSNSSIKICAE